MCHSVQLLKPAFGLAEDPLSMIRETESTTIAGQSPDDSPRILANDGSHLPSSSVPITPIVPIRPPSPEKRIPQTRDSSGFLTALASQERLVLELRENLHRAELDLEKLKRQWALHVAAKRRNEMRQVASLQPLNTSVNGANGAKMVDEESSRSSKEQESHTILPVGRNQSQRKVFSGSRHMKTLSLLSPTAAKDYEANLSANAGSANLGQGVSGRQSSSDNAREVHVTADPVSTASRAPAEALTAGVPKDVILDTGKQLVGDFRQGLWTFFEDLRQATVGEEAINGSTRKGKLI